MDMFINTTSGELTLSLDDYTKVTYLKSYTRQDYTTLLDWSQQSSAIYFGGEYDRQDVLPFMRVLRSNVHILSLYAVIYIFYFLRNAHAQI